MSPDLQNLGDSSPEIFVETLVTNLSGKKTADKEVDSTYKENYLHSVYWKTTKESW